MPQLNNKQMVISSLLWQGEGIESGFNLTFQLVIPSHYPSLCQHLLMNPKQS